MDVMLSDSEASCIRERYEDEILRRRLRMTSDTASARRAGEAFSFKRRVCNGDRFFLTHSESQRAIVEQRNLRHPNHQK
jgi:hypothetical protein